MDETLRNYLERNKINYREHRHPAVFSVAESKKIKKKIPGLHCKTLFLKDSKGNFYLVGMPAEKRLDSNKFRKLINAKKIRFGTSEELRKETNLIPGSVSIFGAIHIKNKTKLIIDEEVWNADSVGFHPNINTSTLEITHRNLKKFYKSLKCEKQILKV